MSKVSIIVPSRNEPYLQKTILDILKNARGDIEILAILDGYWPKAEEIVDDPRVNYLHFSGQKGLRYSVNAGAALAKGEYLFKCDAHVMVAEGFDEALKADCEDNWIVTPRRYPLDPVKWAIEERTDNKYPIDLMYLSEELRGKEWPQGNDPKQLIQDTPISQGSAYFLKKSYFEWLEIFEIDKWGLFFWEPLEMILKCWLSGGRMVVNKKTWYAHWHKNQGRLYSLPKGEQERAKDIIQLWKTGKAWDKQIYPFSYLLEKFPTMPGWEEK